MKNNTVVTIGDRNYLWGIYMLVASMRTSGMDEPVIVGGTGFTQEDQQVLQAWGNVEYLPLEKGSRTLACAKAQVMLAADTDFITWVDSDGFFVGNCSELLPPPTPEAIHVRRRSAKENPDAFRGFCRQGEDGTTIPAEILSAWQKDVPNALAAPRALQSCSSCYLSLHSRQRAFLELWDQQMQRCLPTGDAGVVDRRLAHYHQLDESVLNSLLCFWPEAPTVTPVFRLDKDPRALFVHFIGQPKPWQAWPPNALRHFHSYLSVLEAAIAAGMPIPNGKIPFSLQRNHYWLCRLLAHPAALQFKIRRRLKRLFH